MYAQTRTLILLFSWPDNWTPRAEDCVNAPNPRNASSNNLGRRRRPPNLQVLTAFAAWTVVIAVALAFLICCMTAHPG
ncbi:hypothetical protein C1H46_016326 [Malus baccata]|uniref:Uncharacterized protein n=1 Tax=Malus baccata TaxID=106549 RepID=A0A540MH78_MALBA|nr:hypothetical protein C1H46_016326 [Malus baccata]